MNKLAKRIAVVLGTVAVSVGLATAAVAPANAAPVKPADSSWGY
jgi:hypothetical protein